ncbi:ER protein Pkr1-domain-containing protein [Dioszegia hungarica]|uniref:ER protein Pkr1-domain-containing protein n=1 Tax=Dioszegia hungarica TaxID=4972 RepID=A0AA38HF62_9TREE|nr:ER protein Pkr1-domain-containing protein [Dioszegia hungarica]KAI9638812.1 ER protein Pkr1-domain-containing protein [Dioszegia hungarica]
MSASNEQTPLVAPTTEEAGFVGSIVKSVFEPGANYAVVMAMNVSFFFLILVLFALAFLTSWNKHVLFLLGVTTLLWAAMLWFVVEISKVQTRPDNLPPADPSDPTFAIPAEPEPKKDR